MEAYLFKIHASRPSRETSSTTILHNICIPTYSLETKGRYFQNQVQNVRTRCQVSDIRRLEIQQTNCLNTTRDTRIHGQSPKNMNTLLVQKIRSCIIFLANFSVSSSVKDSRFLKHTTIITLCRLAGNQVKDYTHSGTSAPILYNVTNKTALLVITSYQNLFLRFMNISIIGLYV